MRTFVKECRWGRFILIKGDFISAYADAYGEWAETEIDLFRSLVPSDGVCVEIGANIGLHTIALAKHCHRGRVIAYEPQRPIYNILCGNIALNDVFNADLRNTGVGARNHFLTIQTSRYDIPWNYGNFSLERGFSDEGQYPGEVDQTLVEVVSIDERHGNPELPRLDLLKIDAEGLEPEILEGARRTIAKHRPYVFMEANRAPIAAAGVGFFSTLGYSANWFLPARWRRDNFNASPISNATYDRNIIFAPPDRPKPADNLPTVSPDGVIPPNTWILSLYPHPKDRPYDFHTGSHPM